MKIRTKNDGFSLIEVAIGLLIIGLIVGPLIEEYAIWKNDQIRNLTNGNGHTIESALMKYALNAGCYPVPADPNQNTANANAGKEAAPTPARTDCTALTVAQINAIPVCAGDDATLCKTPCIGANCAAAGNPPILIGDVPFATLGLPKQYITDGYRRKFTYAVSSNLTGLATFVDSAGVIEVQDMNGNSGTNGTTPGPALNNHYAIISHGRDGLGAYTLEGILLGNCPGVGIDAENCDNDGLFTNGYATYQEWKLSSGTVTQYGRQESNPAGASHFDDFAFYETTTTTDVWTKQTTGGTAGNILSHTDPGNVKIKMPTTSGPLGPVAKVDVRGDVQADKLWTNEVCDTSTNTFSAGAYTNKPCAVAGQFKPSDIGGTPVKTQSAGNGIHCNVLDINGNVNVAGSIAAPMIGLSGADEVCADITSSDVPISSNVTVSACPGGQYPYGTDASGNLLCRAPP